MSFESELKLGPGTLYFGETKVSDSVSEFHITQCDEIYYPESYEPILIGINTTSISAELTMDNTLAQDLLFPESSDLREITLNIPVYIQNRRHKKKRINKKWAKQYGYRTEYRKIALRDVKVIPNEHLGGFDLEGVPT